MKIPEFMNPLLNTGNFTYFCSSKENSNLYPDARGSEKIWHSIWWCFPLSHFEEHNGKWHFEQKYVPSIGVRQSRQTGSVLWLVGPNIAGWSSMMISNGSRSLVDTTYLPTYYRNSICLFLDQLLNNLHEVIEYRVHICIAKYFVFVLAQASYHENLFVYATLNSRHHRLFER